MGPSDWPIYLWIINSWLDNFFFHMKFLWFCKKNSYTEETINLFARFGFELLKPCVRDQLNKLPRNSNVLNLKNIKCQNNFDSTFNANKMNVLSLMLTRRLPIIGHRSTTSKQLSSRPTVHFDQTWRSWQKDEGCVHWYTDLCSDSKEEHENYVVSASD